MVELNHNVVSFNSDTLIKGDHGVLVNVYVSKTGSGSDKVEFRNGTTLKLHGGPGPILFDNQLHRQFHRLDWSNCWCFCHKSGIWF